MAGFKVQTVCGRKLLLAAIVRAQRVSHGVWRHSNGRAGGLYDSGGAGLPVLESDSEPDLELRSAATTNPPEASLSTESAAGIITVALSLRFPLRTVAIMNERATVWAMVNW